METAYMTFKICGKCGNEMYILYGELDSSGYANFITAFKGCSFRSKKWPNYAICSGCGAASALEKFERVGKPGHWYPHDTLVSGMTLPSRIVVCVGKDVWLSDLKESGYLFMFAPDTTVRCWTTLPEIPNV